MNWHRSLSILIAFAILTGIIVQSSATTNATSSSRSPAEQEQLQPASSAPASREGGGASRTGPEQQEPQQRTSPGSRAGPDDSEEQQRTAPPRQTEEEEEPLDRPGDGQEQVESLCPEGTVLSSLKGGGGECVQPRLEGDSSIKKAPVAITGNIVYVAWWTNETSNNNEEVMFRASTDGGQTFSERINLSNTTDADSTRAEIDSDADSVVVTWWETNSTNDTPVMRVSDDNGATFGPVLSLFINGTLGEASAD